MTVDSGLFQAAGETLPFSTSSMIHFDNLYYTLLDVVDCNDVDKCKTKTREELVQAMGRGIGATGAHELGHQVRLGFSLDLPCQDCYDSDTSKSYVHFFGTKHWSDSALSIMRKVLPSGN